MGGLPNVSETSVLLPGMGWSHLLVFVRLAFCITMSVYSDAFGTGNGCIVAMAFYPPGLSRFALRTSWNRSKSN